ncbi:MAG: HAD-IB family hydrolase [Verrucomicrobia bacterium]|nr:HAD-IB family hydrolase [Verrucomicrobiota bacterium]
MSSATLAVFDLDDTLIRGNISFAFGAFLYRIGKMRFWSALYCTGTYFRHKFLQRSLRLLHTKVLRRFLRGYSLRTLCRDVEVFLDEWLEKRCYHPALERLRAFQKSGAHVMLISCAPDFLVSAVARRLGVDDWAATRYGVDNRNLLDTIHHFIVGEEKARLVLERARSLCLGREAIAAFSDSTEDLPLLEVAGEAVGVQPGRKLRAICKERGWEVI